MEIVDYIVVGSGCTGAIVAHTLSGHGKSILVLDVGISSESNEQKHDFLQTRTNDQQQSNYFLGKNFEVFSENKHPNIPQQTAQRIFMSEKTDQLIPIDSRTFFPVESLALGGLGNGWGLGSYVFSTQELIKTKLPIQEIKEAYKSVAELIGISGDKNDDASLYCHNNEIQLQNSIDINSSAQHLLNSYNKQRLKFNSKNISLGRPSLALLTDDKDDRKKYTYKDLDFYENEGNSAFRPSIIINKLIQQGNIQFERDWLVISFEELNNIVHVNCINIITKESKTFLTHKLLLSGGTLGTARIVLRSQQSDEKIPIICNAYTYMPMIYLPYLGQKHNTQQSGFAQLAMFYDKYGDHSDVTMASIYNYRSLLNFRILKQMPLNIKDGERFLKLILPSLFIAGIFHPASKNSLNYIKLKKADTITNDQLETHYEYSNSELSEYATNEKIISSSFKKLKCIPLKKVRTPLGGSIHYSGSLPFKTSNEKFSINPNGKLGGYNKIYVADGSGISYLPGKGLTLTLMANAYHVALKAMKDE